MKTKLILFREFLKRNKIFLDILLTICLIFLSFKANQIANSQKEVAYLDKKPKFYIKVESSPIGTDINERERQLLFFNIAGHYENFYEKTIVKFVIEYSDSTNVSKKKSFYINGFFGAEFSGENKQGLIRVLYGYHNESHLDKINLVLRELKDCLNLNYCFTEFYTYSKISYWDILNEKNVQYYNTSFREGVLLTSESGEKIFSDYNKSEKEFKLVEFQDINKDFCKQILLE